MYEYEARVTGITDGDTVTASLDLGFYLAATLRIRLLGVDTPEMHGATRVAGLAARQFVAAGLLGKDVVIRTEKSDSFGRWLGTIYLDGVDFNQRLIEEGYAVPFMTGKMTLPTDPETPSCTIRTLPDHLVGEAARVAAEVYPANRPPIHLFASTLPGDQSDVIYPPGRIAALTDRYWGPTPRLLPVGFLDSPDAATIDLVLAHMNAWDCAVSFRYTADVTQARVRIARAATGYWSYLGTDVLMIPAGQPTMNLQGFTSRTPLSEYKRVVRHETGHTLGFPHEHMRRDLVARIDPEKAVAYFGRTQGWSRRDVYEQVLTPLDEQTLMATPADATSIMCYQLPGSITRDGQPIPGGDDIDASDYAFAAKIYPKAGGPVVPPSPPPAPPVEPPKPEPPKPPEPTKPTEEFGPFDIEVGRASDKLTMLEGCSVFFRFRVRSRAVYVATTAGKVPFRMDLLDAEKKTIASDDRHSGLGPNALIAAPLKRGTYYLRVRGTTPEVRGPFRVKVARSDP